MFMGKIFPSVEVFLCFCGDISITLGYDSLPLAATLPFADDIVIHRPLRPLAGTLSFCELHGDTESACGDFTLCG
jgi:hypothetical protein